MNEELALKKIDQKLDSIISRLNRIEHQLTELVTRARTNDNGKLRGPRGTAGHGF